MITVACHYHLSTNQQKRSTTYVLLHHSTFLAVVRITHSRTSAHDTTSLIRSIVALVANMDQRVGTNVGIADDALSITYTSFLHVVKSTLLTETANC